MSRFTPLVFAKMRSIVLDFIGRAAGVRGSPPKRMLESVATLLVATTIYVFIAEGIFRIANHVPMLENKDFRQARAGRNGINSATVYDPLVGWTTKPFIEQPGFNTLEYGFRSNGEGNRHARTGGVLAVGSSFTAGSEVSDHETWPSQLERLIGRPVNNAGVGNYSADQIVMRAEQLMPVLMPDTVVVDLLADNILGAGYSSYAYPKPFFTVEEGMLRHWNNPVPPMDEPASNGIDIRGILAHFYMIDRVASAFFADQWFGPKRGGFARTGADEVEVTCRLLERLRDKTTAAGVRLVLYLQFAGSHLIGVKAEPVHAALLRECAEDIGVQVVDEYAGLKRLLDSSEADLRANYVVEPDGLTGHKSPLGNLMVAERVYAALQALPPAPNKNRVADASEAPSNPKSSGANMLPNPDFQNLNLGPGSSVRLDPVFNWFIGPKTNRLSPQGGAGEHYLGAGGIPIGTGPVIASIEIKAEGTSRGRFQFLSSEGDGGIVDFDLKSESAAPLRAGAIRNLKASIDPLSFGWYRVQLRAVLPPAGKAAGSLIVQLANDRGEFGFSPSGQSLLIRRAEVFVAQ